MSKPLSAQRANFSSPQLGNYTDSPDSHSIIPRRHRANFHLSWRLYISSGARVIGNAGYHLLPVNDTRRRSGRCSDAGVVAVVNTTYIRAMCIYRRNSNKIQCAKTDSKNDNNSALACIYSRPMKVMHAIYLAN